MNHHLKKYRIQKHSNGNTVVLVSGSKVYLEILIEVFSHYNRGRIFEDAYRRYDYGIFFNKITNDEQREIKKFLQFLSKHIYLEDDLDQTFALDYHMCPSYYEDCINSRTKIGECVFQAKYRSNSIKRKELISHFENFIQQHYTYLKADFIIPVPFYGEKHFDLPTITAKALCQRFDKEDISLSIKKIKPTKPMKDINGTMAKYDNIQGCFEITNPTLFKNKSIIIIDDLYETGTTLAELAQTISKAGAKVLGLVATKTLKGSSWD